MSAERRQGARTEQKRSGNAEIIRTHAKEGGKDEQTCCTGGCPTVHTALTSHDPADGYDNDANEFIVAARFLSHNLYSHHLLRRVADFDLQEGVAAGMRPDIRGAAQASIVFASTQKEGGNRAFQRHITGVQWGTW